ncbi:MAG: rhomboid family intramembrane serine protease [Candidatus Omnitrophota bacterium]
MIPLRDKLRSKRIPIITITLILFNIYVFIKEILSGPGLGTVIDKYALVPAHFLSLDAVTLSNLITKSISLFSSLFLHAGWLHLIGNMWYLWIFGDNVEYRFGHFRYLFFYISCGIIGNLTHVIMNVNSTMPTMGASGCIAGVLGAYFLFSPKAKIVTVLPIFVFWTIADVPAFFFLGIWFLIQFLSGNYYISGAHASIAWWAHIGGFIGGAVLKMLFTKNRG